MTIRKFLSILLALVMCFSMFSTGAVAADTTATAPSGAITFTNSVANLTKSDSARSFSFDFNFTAVPVNFMTFNLKVTGGNGDPTITGSRVSLYDDTSYPSPITWSSAEVQGTFAADAGNTYNMIKVSGFKFNLPANAYGEFTITLEVTEWGYYTNYASSTIDTTKTYFVQKDGASKTYTTTVTVANPDAEPDTPVNSDFELSYELTDANGTALSGTEGGYYAADPGTVNATIYLESSKDWELQGYDICVQASEKLTNATVSNYINGLGKVIATGDSTITRIQFLYNDTQGMNYTLTPNEKVAIATITYTIESGAVVYGDKLDISITSASAIAAESTPMGLKPTLDTAVKGVEITTQYDVIFDADNADGDSDKATVKVGHGTVATEPATEPTKTGYTFSGWFDGNTEWNFATKITQEKTLTAKWTANEYTVTLDAGEHGSCEDESIDVTYGGTYAELPTPTANAGYTFIGWFSGDVQVKNTDTVEITNDITLTAQYAGIKYYVTFNVNGGTGDDVPTQKEVVYGEDLDLPDVSREFYELLGWNTDPEATEALSAEELNTLTTTAGSEVVLYAIWSDNAYTVKFETGVDNVTIADKKVVKNTPVTAPSDELVKAGYTFEGWYNGQTEWDFNDPVTDNMTLTAKWTINTYTVTFMDGEEVVGTDTYTVEDKSIDVPEVPTKDGYTSAWEAYDLNELGNKTVNVVYTPIEYTVTFKNGDQVVGTDTYTVEDKSIDVPEVPTKDGYTSAWEAYDLNELGNKTVNVIFSVITYTITYQDGTSTTTQSYTIEDAVNLLDDVAEDNYKVKTWTVTTAAGNWTANAEHAAKADIAAGKYGNVTLTATDWESTIDFAVEAYTYALKGDALLIVSADGVNPATHHYTVNGEKMYYVADSNYLAGSEAVFLYIVTPDVSGTTLSFDANKLEVVAGAAETLDKSKGDVNGDNETDIGDANAVYQMLKQEAAGSYYNSYTKLSIKGRLIADMNTSAVATRGSIEDVAAIVGLLNNI